ncbi:MAG: hypothetical protein M1833_006824 [Piccolia ochrophora]|nr:MAG: hypothetical protein M1833_006824 [Piccolia ochrophora]
MADVPPQTPPVLRTFSPSPSTSPTPAISACPPLERSVSTASSASDFSARSTTSRSSDITIARRRGYVRPQATNFADSARNRESVMNLGSIAHVQSYFARTGLLDGKGAQLSREKEKARSASSQSRTASMSSKSSDWGNSSFLSCDRDSTYSSMRSTPEPALSGEADMYSGGAFVESPIEEEEEEGPNYEDMETMMLPPTVSTYVHRPKHVAPPPDVLQLRKNLRSALQDAGRVMEDLGKNESQEQGWYELQGMNVIDVMTLAIRAARLYYTAHEQPAKLAAIKSERKLRQELLGVMDVLKRMAARNFAGGVRDEDRQTMMAWVGEVESLLRQEEDREAEEARIQESWHWRSGDWQGREREREQAFLRSYDAGQTLPEWTAPAEPSDLPTPFLKDLQNGLRLVQLHNEIIRKSKRPFGHISAFHADTMKPYRCAENLRFWMKAAELRWGVKLKIDVMAVVHGENQDAWQAFEAAVLRWSGQVRVEISDEWKRRSSSLRIPGQDQLDRGQRTVRG